MGSDVYPAAFESRGLGWLRPGDDERDTIDRLIFDELVPARPGPQARATLYRVLASLRDRGCDAAVLGCTELPLIADPADAPLPLLDSTRLLARAALHASVAGDPPGTT